MSLINFLKSGPARPSQAQQPLAGASLETSLLAAQEWARLSDVRSKLAQYRDDLLAHQQRLVMLGRSVQEDSANLVGEQQKLTNQAMELKLMDQKLAAVREEMATHTEVSISKQALEHQQHLLKEKELFLHTKFRQVEEEVALLKSQRDKEDTSAGTGGRGRRKQGGTNNGSGGWGDEMYGAPPDPGEESGEEERDEQKEAAMAALAAGSTASGAEKERALAVLKRKSVTEAGALRGKKQELLRKKRDLRYAKDALAHQKQINPNSDRGKLLYQRADENINNTGDVRVSHGLEPEAWRTVEGADQVAVEELRESMDQAGIFSKKKPAKDLVDVQQGGDERSLERRGGDVLDNILNVRAKGSPQKGGAGKGKRPKSKVLADRFPGSPGTKHDPFLAPRDKQDAKAYYKLGRKEGSEYFDFDYTRRMELEDGTSGGGVAADAGAAEDPRAAGAASAARVPEYRSAMPGAPGGRGPDPTAFHDYEQKSLARLGRCMRRIFKFFATGKADTETLFGEKTSCLTEAMLFEDLLELARVTRLQLGERDLFSVFLQGSLGSELTPAKIAELEEEGRPLKCRRVVWS